MAMDEVKWLLPELTGESTGRVYADDMTTSFRQTLTWIRDDIDKLLALDLGFEELARVSVTYGRLEVNPLNSQQFACGGFNIGPAGASELLLTALLIKLRADLGDLPNQEPL